MVSPIAFGAPSSIVMLRSVRGLYCSLERKICVCSVPLFVADSTQLYKDTFIVNSMWDTNEIPFTLRYCHTVLIVPPPMGCVPTHGTTIRFYSSSTTTNLQRSFSEHKGQLKLLCETMFRVVIRCYGDLRQWSGHHVQIEKVLAPIFQACTPYLKLFEIQVEVLKVRMFIWNVM